MRRMTTKFNSNIVYSIKMIFSGHNRENFFPVCLVFSKNVNQWKPEWSSFQVLWSSPRTVHLETKRSHEGEPSRAEVCQARERAEGEWECWTTQHQLGLLLYWPRLRMGWHRWVLAPEFVLILARSGLKTAHSQKVGFSIEKVPRPDKFGKSRCQVSGTNWRNRICSPQIPMALIGSICHCQKTYFLTRSTWIKIERSIDDVAIIWSKPRNSTFKSVRVKSERSWNQINDLPRRDPLPFLRVFVQ
jgi:hypothetical protein